MTATINNASEAFSARVNAAAEAELIQDVREGALAKTMLWATEKSLIITQVSLVVAVFVIMYLTLALFRADNMVTEQSAQIATLQSQVIYERDKTCIQRGVDIISNAAASTYDAVTGVFK